MLEQETFQMWQFVGIIFTICAGLLAPAVWFTRNQANKTNKQSEKLFEALKDSTKEMVESISASQEKNSTLAREDLKEFRSHFDKRIGEIYSSIETKNKELREYIATEINFIKALITELEKKIDTTREKNHELEKELMRMQNDNQRNFISKDHFDAIIKLQGNFDDPNNH